MSPAVSRQIRVAAAVLAAAVAIACTQNELYKSFGVTAVTIQTGMQAYADMVVAGKVDAATQAKVKAAYDAYYGFVQAARGVIAANGDASAELRAALAAAAPLLELLRGLGVRV